MSYLFSALARYAHLEHVAYSEGRRPGLGARYLGAFEAAMVKVCENPERFRAELPPAIRRYRVPGSPYHILYCQSGAEVEFLAVALHSRRPRHWTARRCSGRK